MSPVGRRARSLMFRLASKFRIGDGLKRFLSPFGRVGNRPISSQSVPRENQRDREPLAFKSDTYDAFGQSAAEAQAVSGAVTTGTPTVGLAYDVGTGAVVKEVRDVNTADAADFDATRLPAGWATPAGYGSERVTAYAVDAFGRTTVQTSPAGRVTVTTYDDAAHEVRVYDGWAGSAATGPTAVYRQDWAGGYTEALTMSAPPSVGAGGLPDGTEPIGNLQSLSRTLLNAAGQAVETDAYSNLGGISYSTAAHLGSPGTP